MPQKGGSGFDTSRAPDYIKPAGSVGSNPYNVGPREVAHRAVKALSDAGEGGGGIDYESLWQGANGVIGVVGVELDGVADPTAETVLGDEFSEIDVVERDLVDSKGYTIAITEE